MDVIERWEELSEPLRDFDPRGAERVAVSEIMAPLRYPRKVLCSGPYFRDHLDGDGYTLPDGATYLLPFLTVFEESAGKIAAVRVFGDISTVQHGWPTGA